MLMCFSGRLKRRGPADKAYERKRHYGTVLASDTRGRAFLAGVTWTQHTGGSTASSDTYRRMKTMSGAENVDAFVKTLEDDVSMTRRRGSLEEESREVLDASHTTG